jgi:hypothetical protein
MISPTFYCERESLRMAITELIDPTVTDQMGIDTARTQFNGTVIVGRDLVEVSVRSGVAPGR